MLKKIFICFCVVFFVCNSAVGLLFGVNGSSNAAFKDWNKFDDNISEKSQFQDENSDDDKNEKKSKIYNLDLFDSWLVYSSFDFDIYYYDEIVVRDVLKNIDFAYHLIVEDLGYVFFPTPKRIKIYVYKNHYEYVAKTNGGNWSGGYADIKKNAIFTYEQKDLMRHVLVHELTHLVFDSYMGSPRNMNMNWLNEGLAIYEEKRFFDKKWNLKYLKTKEKESVLYSLKDAFRAESGLENDGEKIALWYLQMGTVVYFLFTLNKEGFKVFCENFKVYKNVDEALKYTYPWDFKSVDDLDREWRKWLYQEGDYV